MRGAAKKSKNPYLTVMWSEGGAQPALEEAMGLTFGYPALIAVSVEKKVRIYTSTKIKRVCVSFAILQLARMRQQYRFGL